MKQITFVKYNRTRREEFQIRTTILIENGKKYVEKSALGMAGFFHVRSFKTKYEQMKEQSAELHYSAPVIDEERSTARFEYIEGRTLAEEIGNKIENKAVPYEKIEKEMQKICHVKEDFITKFVITEEFRRTFMDVKDENEELLLNEEELQIFGGNAYSVFNIDALFENILITENGYYGFDYEWVFDFPIPVEFIRWRILYYFYNKYHNLIEDSLENIFDRFGITPELAEVCMKMEQGFQYYVHGENQKVQLVNYIKDYRHQSDMEDIENAYLHEKEKNERQKLEIQEKDTTIRKIQEVQRLTNNHVTNLEVMIKDLRHEVDEQAKLLVYLNKHEALIYKVVRKIRQKVNHIFPQGTVKRKKLVYVKNAVFHPVRSFRLFTTAEGRNLIDGDFNIGEVYRQHGKLHFEVFEKPTVSIIIPVYNQIHYTYACLLSILEHTKDVSYEVIIADDVSTDATAQLGKYAENVKICRNSTNQGFLRNCNQAAKTAAGKYIMFLNNDTQVTENWLSSLVNLIESDATIGMVGSKLVYPDGRLQEAGGIIWSDGSGWNYGRLDNPDKPEYNYVKDVDYISGAAILLSNDLWKHIGGFDTRFTPAYCEDSDLAFEVRKAGYRVVYQPLSKVIHFEGISNGTDTQGTGLKRYQVANSKKLKEKWAEEFAKQSENNGNPDPFRARERSQNKKMILVVDHYVPTFDKDAGSKTTYQYLKMFVKKGYSVKFLGDNFLHEEPYTTTLEQMGIEVLYGQEFAVKIWDWLKDHGDDIEFAYLNRPHIASKYIDYIKENTNIKVIYYGHDLHFLREGREYALTGDLKLKQSAEYWKSIELTLMNKAAISYYPSYIEKDAIHEIDPAIKVKDITAYVYEEFKDDIDLDFGKREGLLFVGGFAHPPNADAVLWFAKEIYPLIREQIKVPFYIVGSKVTEEIKALEQPDNGIIVKGFVTEEELSELYKNSRIVVVPLRYGAGVKGKVIEALYNGSVIVTTSIGAEGIPDIHGILSVKDEPSEFADEVVRLYGDTETCAKICQDTQTYIKEYFSVDAAWSKIEEDFNR